VRASARAVRERLLAVLHLEDPPWRIALALAIGVFISFTPFLGFQTLLALAVGWICRLNKAAVVVGAWLNLPWTMPLAYAGALWLGSLLLPSEPWTLALLTGSTILGAAAAVITYVVVFGLMVARRRRRRRRGRPEREAA
jgi:uncharacterized protein (DUF2062 family)